VCCPGRAAHQAATANVCEHHMYLYLQGTIMTKMVYVLCYDVCHVLTRGVRPAPPEGSPDLPLVFQMLSDNLQLFRDLGEGHCTGR